MDLETGNIDDQQKIQIRWMLSRIKGEDVIRTMNPDELAEWVVDMVETKGTLRQTDFSTIAKIMMCFCCCKIIHSANPARDRLAKISLHF
jgi:hypothetical protein